MSFENLFSPYHFPSHRTKNRVLFPAVVTNRALGNRVTEAHIDYYGARARGGAGIVVSEAMAIESSSVTASEIIDVFHPGNPDYLRRWAEVVLQEDCLLLGQIFHLGRHHVTAPGAVSVSPTGQFDPASWAVPHRLSTQEVAQMADRFVAAAACLRKAGWSGVELHGAQGFLILQFLSPVNDREDGYGGDLAGRCRFLVEIYEGIRQECGKDFLVALKMPADEGLGPRGLDRQGAIEIVRHLRSLNAIDLFSFGHGGPGPTFDQHVPDMAFPKAPFADHLPDLRRAADGVPVTGLGKIMDAEAGEALLVDGCCDFVGYARPLIADAAWPIKHQRRDPDPVRPCIYCNVCWAQLPKHYPLACVTNPLLGQADEATWEAPAAATPLRVIVVGGGPAGLSAAWIAAACGHHVTLLESDAELGGKAAWQAQLPGRTQIADLVRYQVSQTRRYGVEVRTGETANTELIAKTRPDIVLLATGSTFATSGPLYDAPNSIDIVSLSATLQNNARIDESLVVFDQFQTESVYAAIDLLAETFRSVLILSPRPAIATESAFISVPGILRRLAKRGVRFETYAQPVSLQDNTLTWKSSFSGEERTVDADRFVYCTPRRAEDSLAGELAQLGIETRTIGDAHAPRNLAMAVHDGHHAALALGS